MEEIWKEIPGFDGYQASNLGRIRSIDRVISCKDGVSMRQKGRILKPYPMKHGYLKMKIAGKTALAHRLILMAFSPPTDPGFVVAHGDGVRTNNSLSNLRWATTKENVADKCLHGTSQIGERHPMAKLTEDHVREIRKIGRTMTLAEIGKKFGLGKSHVSRIIKGQSWQHVAVE